MSGQASAKLPQAANASPFECVALLLQGGGALGAYQGGVYEAMAEAGIHPNWVAGISIGAINSAIIAGNPPHERVGKLRAFWEQITKNFFEDWAESAEKLLAGSGPARAFLSQMSAGVALASGASGFFSPRALPPWALPDGTPEATSYYDTAPLKATLERLIDFDRINAQETRLSVGAVNIKTGNFTYFDTATHTIGPLHVMASGALPPGFPAVQIDGEYYWDGGLISNTPLQWVTDSLRHIDTLAFQVDLWSAEGKLPSTMTEVLNRQKEIQFSSRTRANTTRLKKIKKMGRAITDLLDKLPEDLKATPEAKLLAASADRSACNIIHLIYHTKSYESQAKDYEFSRLSMEDHWRAGYNDTARTLAHPDVLKRHSGDKSVFTFDLARHVRE